MPEYVFQSTSGKTQDLYYKISEAPKVGETIMIEGKPWTRIFTVPQARIAVTIDPFSKADFVKKIDGKNDTLGDTWDRSEEMSQKRRDKEGIDPVREKHFDDFAKQRRGKQHPARLREQAKKKADETNQSKALRDLGISISVNP
jgi:hypothetical protein